MSACSKCGFHVCLGHRDAPDMGVARIKPYSQGGLDNLPTDAPDIVGRLASTDPTKAKENE